MTPIRVSVYVCQGGREVFRRMAGGFFCIGLREKKGLWPLPQHPAGHLAWVILQGSLATPSFLCVFVGYRAGPGQSPVTLLT